MPHEIKSFAYIFYDRLSSHIAFYMIADERDVVGENIGYPVKNFESIPAQNQPASADQAVSCLELTVTNRARCYEKAEQILKSTVHLEIQAWAVKENESGYEIASSFGHATLKKERLLVTHNHYGVLQPDFEINDQIHYFVVIVSKCDESASFQAPFTDFEIVWRNAETMILAYKDGLMAAELGLSSAEFEPWSAVPLRVGIEVAQVDWDGETTRVDWTTVKEINLRQTPPTIVLESYATTGASGGGVFWQGKHIGNNWCHIDYPTQATALTEFATLVALNSAEVAGWDENGD